MSGNPVETKFSDPIPLRRFFELYLPAAEHQPQAPPAEFDYIRGLPKDEIARGIIRRVKRHRLAPGLHLFVPKVKRKVMECAARLDEDNEDEFAECDRLAPSLAVRKASPRKARRRSARSKANTFEEYHDFATCLLGIDISSSSKSDPWSNSRRKKEIRQGQEKFQYSLSVHVNAMFARQQRTFLFHLALTGRNARFFRYDRGGCNLSEAFNYVERPELLAEFFWRFAHLSDTERGLDPTARPATRREAALFDSEVRAFLERMARPGGRVLPKNAGATLDEDTGTYPTWKIRVRNALARTPQESELLVRRPFAGENCIVGRATRAYLAYDTALRRLVFFKDSWREDVEYRKAEFDAIVRLREAEARHVPVVLNGGDVAGDEQETAAIDGLGTMVFRIHHRVVQEITFPVSAVHDACEFLQVMRDALCGLCDAHTVGFLHRDVSWNNVMMTEDGRGVMVDWDWTNDVRSNYDSDPGAGIGTWWYLSMSLIEDSSRNNNAADDLQSFFWVFLHSASSLFASNQGAAMQRVNEIFEDPDNHEKEAGEGLREQDEVQKHPGSGQDKGEEHSEEEESEERRQAQQALAMKRAFLQYPVVELQSAAVGGLVTRLGEMWRRFEEQRSLSEENESTESERFDSQPELFGKLAQEMKSEFERALREAKLETLTNGHAHNGHLPLVVQSHPSASSMGSVAQPNGLALSVNGRKRKVEEREEPYYDRDNPRRSKRVKHKEQT